MVESAGLSPPYDGSEFELFPELSSVEPEEMVDIESLADQALAKSVCSDNSFQNFCDEAQSPEILDHGFQSDNCETASRSSISDEETEEDDHDNLLRYLIGETGVMTAGASDGENDITSTQTRSRAGAGRKRRLSSLDSGNFSENAKSPCAHKIPKIQQVRNQTRKIKPPKTSVTVVSDDGVKKTVQGPNRNAVMAKLNRERKKQIMSNLEKKAGLLGTENDALKKQNVCLKKKLGLVEKELQYVKGVLANQSALAGLLKNIQATELEFHSSMKVAPSTSAEARRKRRRIDDHDYCLELEVEQPQRELADEKINEQIAKIIPVESETAGVCLHVSGESVSLEFCSKCNVRAKAGRAAATRQGNR